MHALMCEVEMSLFTEFEYAAPQKRYFLNSLTSHVHNKKKKEKLKQIKR